MFELVQTASGIGPKVALAMLSVLDPDRLRSAIAQSDLAVLTSVPGIGRKGAERIVVELKDRVGLATTTSATGAPAWREQVHEALLGLGWSARDAESAVDAVAGAATDGSEPDVVEGAAERGPDDLDVGDVPARPGVTAVRADRAVERGRRGGG